MHPIHDDFIVLDSGPPLRTQDSTWATTMSGTNTHFVPLVAESGRTGIMRIRTSNSNGSFGRMYKAVSGWHLGTQVNQVWFDDVTSFEWQARVPEITSIAFKMGLAESINLTRAVAFEFDTNVSPSLYCNTYGASGQESTGVSMPSDGLFHSYRVDVSSGQVDFSIDGVVVATHTDLTKQPRGDALTPYAAVFSRAAAYKYLELDRFDLD